MSYTHARYPAADYGAFWEVGELQFADADTLVVDPTEEKLRDEFGAVNVLHLPLQSVLRVEEVSERGQAVIRDRESGEKVTALPLPPNRRKS